MRKIGTIVLLLFCLDAFSQNNLTDTKPETSQSEIFSGSITGQIATTDGQPAASVTVSLLENGKFAVTDEQGRFSIKNLKDGTYTLQITLAGLKPESKTVEIRNGSVEAISIVLSENARQLAEVVVAANQKKLSVGKINIADRDYPQSTGIVTAKVISDQQALRLGDVVKNVPGVSLVQTRFGVNETYGARGYIIGVTGGAGGGSIFKNGLPTNIAGMPEAATLESVEIIKGSTNKTGFWGSFYQNAMKAALGEDQFKPLARATLGLVLMLEILAILIGRSKLERKFLSLFNFLVASWFITLLMIFGVGFSILDANFLSLAIDTLEKINGLLGPILLLVVIRLYSYPYEALKLAEQKKYISRKTKIKGTVL